MKPTYRQAMNILDKAWTIRHDDPTYPEYDDIMAALASLGELVDVYYAIRKLYETRN